MRTKGESSVLRRERILLKSFLDFFQRRQPMDEMNERHSDFEWLQQFARSGNQNAFREIVRRHIDLIFSTAKRKWRAAVNAPQSRRSARFVSVGQARSVWSARGFSTALVGVRGMSLETAAGMNREPREQALTRISRINTNPNFPFATISVIRVNKSLFLPFRVVRGFNSGF